MTQLTGLLDGLTPGHGTGPAGPEGYDTDEFGGDVDENGNPISLDSEFEGAPLPAGIDKQLDKYMNGNFSFGTDPTSGEMRVTNSSGQVVYSLDPKRFGGLADSIQKKLAGNVDGHIGVDSSGRFYIDAGKNGPQNSAPAGFKGHPNSTSTPAASGGRRSIGDGSGYTGAPPSAATPRTGGGLTANGGGTTTTTTGGGGLELGGGGGPSPIDPNAPLGTDFGGAEGSFSPGDQRFNDPSVFNTPDSFTRDLGPDASLNDILFGAMGEQRATRDAALGIQGGLASSFEDNALRQQNEGNALELGANPFSLDDDTISRIQGRQTDLIGRNTERLQQASAGRAASSGISRSGIQGTQQDRFDIAGAQQIGESQRGLLVEQATRRPGELATAIGVGNDTLQQQQRSRESIAGGAVNILSQSNPTADAALLGTLAGGGTPQIRIGDRANPYNPAGYTSAGNNNPIQF